MRAIHPLESVNGLPPEDVFYAVNRANATVAEGYVVTTHHPYLFPERPLNLYLCVRFVTGGDFILGALMGRVQQIHEQNLPVPMRVFAQATPQDAKLLDLYMGAGFDQNDGLDIVVLQMPDSPAGVVDNYRIDFTPLDHYQFEQSFLTQMNASRLLSWKMDQLRRYMHAPNFIALNMMDEYNRVIGGIAFSGQGDKATLLGLYVAPEYRQKGIAKRLIASGMQHLQKRGVTRVEAEIVRRCPQQRALAKSCHARMVRTAFLYPGINYD